MEIKENSMTLYAVNSAFAFCLRITHVPRVGFQNGVT